MLERSGVDDVNDRSIVLMAQRSESSVLLTGDLSAIGEWCFMTYYPSFDADVLQLGHHVSASSSMSAFLEFAYPSICLIPVGKNNYGHPTSEALARAGEVAPYIYRTDLNGTVELTTSGDGYFTVYCQRG